MLNFSCFTPPVDQQTLSSKKQKSQPGSSNSKKKLIWIWLRALFACVCFLLFATRSTIIMKSSGKMAENIWKVQILVKVHPWTALNHDDGRIRVNKSHPRSTRLRKISQRHVPNLVGSMGRSHIYLHELLNFKVHVRKLTKTKGPYGKVIYILNYSIPPPSNSDHQDYYIFSRDPYKPSFATLTGRGDNPIYIYIYTLPFDFLLVLGGHLGLSKHHGWHHFFSFLGTCRCPVWWCLKQRFSLGGQGVEFWKSSGHTSDQSVTKNIK